jgi:predicted RNA binding protein YcfA (HicA-like mRNA interferase family)
MARGDKLVDRLRRRPPEADFDDIRKLLEDNGWAMRWGSGHAVFRKPGRRPLIVPMVKGRKVKRYIIDRVLEALGLDE